MRHTKLGNKATRIGDATTFFYFYCTALSPESTRGLSRRKEHVQSGMSDLEDKIARRDSKGTGHPTYTQIGQEINDVETDMEDVILLCGLSTRARS